MELWEPEGTFEFAGSPPVEGTYKGAMAIQTLYKNRLRSSGMGLKVETKRKKAEDVIKVDKTKVGTFDAVYQDIQGTYLKKDAPFDPNAKTTKMENYRQLYVVFETKDGQYFMTLVGPAKTIEKHKKAFDEWLKNFK